MLLYFHYKLKELRITALEFFETAYVFAFDKQPVVQDDYCQYLLHSILPVYVRKYLNHLQENERGKDSLYVV